MLEILNKILPSNADESCLYVDNQLDMLDEADQNRVSFNAQFKKTMHQRIRPVIERLIEELADMGHWVDVHTLSNEKYLMYIHQCYTFSWKNGGRCELAIVANYDYKQVFIILEQYNGICCQQRFQPSDLDCYSLYKWLTTAFTTR
jgi:hypothetical protein